MESGIKNKYSHAGQIYMILFLSLFLHRPWYPLIPYAGSTLAPCQNTLRKQAAHISSPQGTHQPAGSLNQRRGHPKKIGPQQISSTNVTMFLTLLWPCQPISFTTTSFDVLSNPVDSPKKFTGWQLPGKMNASEPHSYPIHCHKLVKPPNVQVPRPCSNPRIPQQSAFHTFLAQAFLHSVQAFLMTHLIQGRRLVNVFFGRRILHW